VANGWLRRARRLLEGHHDSAEYGWLLLREADARLSRGAVAAAAGAADAVALGRRHRDPDLEHLALSLEGLAEVAAGSVAEGMQELDEATAAVVAGEFADRSAAGGRARSVCRSAEAATAEQRRQPLAVPFRQVAIPRGRI
jgi:hypothetical protein